MRLDWRRGWKILHQVLASRHIYPWPFSGRPPKHALTTWTVTDDWPDPVPVTETEIEVFERWFGDLFDEMFGPDAGSPDSGAKIELENGTKK